MEVRGKFQGNSRAVPVSMRDYSQILLQNVSGAKTIVPSRSGNPYVFEPGQVLSVDARDVEMLLALQSGSGCVGCGGSAPNPLFVKVEG
jgi:hypothetical protein